MSKPRSFFLDVKIDSLPKGKSLRAVISDINRIIGQGDSSYKVIYKFKVTGEPRVTSVLEATDSDAGLEKIVSALAELGIFDVTCTPQTSYEAYAQNLLAVDPSVASPSTHTLDKKHTFWMKLTVGYEGMTLPEIGMVMRREAESAFGLRSQGKLAIDMFKVLSRWEMNVYMSMDDQEEYDVVLGRFPLFIENGHNTNTDCRAVQPLDAYIGATSK